MASKPVITVPKTFIVQRVYESIVTAIDRDEAIAIASRTAPTGEPFKVIAGTPKQMKRDDVK